MQWFLTGVQANPKGNNVKEGEENVEDKKKKIEGRLGIKNVEESEKKKKKGQRSIKNKKRYKTKKNKRYLFKP